MIRLDALVIIFIIILSLWSITKTLERLINMVLEKQDIQNKLLEEIKAKLESNFDK